MAFYNAKSVRFQYDPESVNPGSPDSSDTFSRTNDEKIEELQLKESQPVRPERPFHKKRLRRVFPEDYDQGTQRKILDPRGHFVTQWNRYFLVVCLISLFIDPLFLYMPGVRDEVCMTGCDSCEIVLTFLRSIIDVFYVTQIMIRFRTAYIAPSSRVFGRGELVIDPPKIAARYMRKEYWLDLVAALPVPQVLIWIFIPLLRGTNKMSTKMFLRISLMLQFLLRSWLIFPLSSRIIKTAGVMVGAPWAGAAYNLLLYMLASHVIGSCWYLLAVERLEQCWRQVCNLQQPSCQYRFFQCHSMDAPDRLAWLRSGNISTLCSPKGDFYQFGIYADALTNKVPSTKMLMRVSYGFWWGFRNLSSIGQGLFTSAYVGEIDFAIIIAILGLVLFALLIGNMQTYLQSHTLRLEQWRVRRTDAEQWMHHRQLPHELREKVRRYDMYNWVTTRGVNEETIIRDLPLDLRRDIKRHLCLDLVRRVPLFDQMDERMLDAICERLKPVLCTPGICLIREGDPVNEMLFIIRGHLDSYTTDGGRSGFFNSSRLGPGEFCGEELLTWALDPRPSIILPTSTRTVTAINEVEAFAFVSEDIKFVASQFRRLNSKLFRHTFRYHSHQWRTWAACFIQAAWFRYKRRKEADELKAMLQIAETPWRELTDRSWSVPARKSEYAKYVYTLTRSTRMSGTGSMRNGNESEFLSSLHKPLEPDFCLENR